MAHDAPAPDLPLALVGREGRRRVVLSVDLAARRLGLRPGTPVAKVQALYPDLVFMDADPEGDRQGLEKLALWFQNRISPLVATDPPDGLVLNTTGADHLHGGERTMLTDMIHRLSSSGFRAKAAVAETWGAAHALARYGQASLTVVPQGDLASVLSDLPIEALRLPPRSIEGLIALGVSRIGPLAAMPRAPLTLRFGPDIARRLDQAFGRVNEAIIPIRPVDPVQVVRNFAEPMDRRQTVSSLIEEEESDVCDLIDTLANRVGTHALYRFAAVESDLPERSFCRVPALAPEEAKDWPDH
ncbi:DNA polymerase protein [Gluconobacter frateurii M-2]|nr:DNA polymerase protein [Gluconobacter frateurii M-2]